MAPLLVALRGRSLTRAFGLGLTTGIVYFAGTLYWITHVMVVYGHLPGVVGVLVNAVLVAYMALFPAVFAVVTRRIVMTFGIRWLMAAPLVWVATELGRTYVSGFPWVLLGYSQTSVLPIAQLASVLGVYGVSALVCAVSAATATAVLAQQPSNWRPAVGATAAMVAAVTIFGVVRVQSGRLTREGDALRVGLVQGNIDQAEKWDVARASAIFESYMRLSQQTVNRGADIVIWPESSTPFRFGEDAVATERVRQLARDGKVSVLVGSDEVEREPRTRYFNSAFLIKPDGSTGAVYRKLRLVPFGEFVPFRSVFFFAAPLIETVADFSPGEAAILLPVGDRLVSTAICYEIIYPDLVRGSVRGGSELLVTITNDAWFGRTSAPYQHFAHAAMRAIENGRYMVRAANTGISGIVDPYGRVVAQSDIYETDVIVDRARYVSELTIYTRIGDVFAYGSALGVLAMLVIAGRRVQYARGSGRAR